MSEPDAPDTRSILDPRVVSSFGGGLFPEQHWGVLVNGIPFYFRMRHNSATLKIGPVGVGVEYLPLANPDYVKPTLTQEQRTEIRAEGMTEEQINRAEAYVQIVDGFSPTPINPAAGMFWGPIGHVVPYEDDKDQGWFTDDESRQRTFTECLDQIEALGYGDAFTVDPAIFDREEVVLDDKADL